MLPLVLIVASIAATDLHEAKELVAAQMLDPESARFRNAALYSDADGFLSLCGDVNAKNRLGGYVGFRPFVYHVDSASLVILDDDGPDSAFPIARELWCKRVVER